MRLAYLGFAWASGVALFGAPACDSGTQAPSPGGSGGNMSGGSAGSPAGGTGAEGGTGGSGATGGLAGAGGAGGTGAAAGTGGTGAAAGTGGTGATGGSAGSGQGGSAIDAGKGGGGGVDAGTPAADAQRDTGSVTDGSGPQVVTEVTIPRLTGCNGTTPFPHDPAVDETNGIVYYVDSDNSCVGRYDPGTGQFSAWPTPTPNSYPHGLTVGPGGHVFYTGQRANLIGRLDPLAGQITTEYPAMTDPHTPHYHQGAIWFTAQSGNRYGRLDPTSGNLVLYNVPTANARPYGMDDAPNGRLWIALFGTNKLGEIDPANPGTLIEHVLPNAASRPRRLAVDKQGRVWYGDYASSRDRLGRFDPATNEFREWATPSSTGLPYGITIGPDDRVWYNDDGASLMVAFDPVAETSQTVSIPTRGSTVRNVAVDMPRRRIWLALSGTGRLGLIQL